MSDAEKPLAYLRWMMKKYPEAAKIADAYRARKAEGDPRFQWPDWCFLPMAGTSFIASDKGRRMLDVERAEDTMLLAVFLPWRATQDIVVFDRDVYDEIVRTPLSDDVPDDIFKRIPAWCIYIRLYDDTWEGAFVHLEYAVQTGRDELRMLFLARDQKNIPPYMPSVLYLGTGSIAEGMRAFQEHAEKRMETLREKGMGYLSEAFAEMKAGETPEDQEAAEKIRCMEKDVLSLLLYLCSENPGWAPSGETSAPSRPAPKRVKSGWRLFPPEKPKVWHVGEDIGRSIREARASAMKGAHKGPRPHIRRAHWHSYWTGRKVMEEEKTEV